VDRTAVNSSNIRSIGWEDGELEVEFNNGRTYVYEKVPEATFRALIAAESVGSYFDANVRKVGFKFREKRSSRPARPRGRRRRPTRSSTSRR
jgi:hypothetical protein